MISLCSTTGRCRIFFLNAVDITALISIEGSNVVRSRLIMLRNFSFCKETFLVTQCTISLSVKIPTNTLFSSTTNTPLIFPTFDSHRLTEKKFHGPLYRRSKLTVLKGLNYNGMKSKHLPDFTKDVCTTHRKALNKLQTIRAVFQIGLSSKGILTCIS